MDNSSKLFLTNARSRLYFGTVQSNLPSRFLSEIPEEFLELRENEAAKNVGGSNGFGGHSRLRSPLSTRATTDFLDELDYDRGNFSWD